MKILVLSDIHANNFALEKVIEDANTYHAGYEAVWFLGDLVGYGANPVESYEILQQACNHNGQHHIWLGGNHEETLKNIEKNSVDLRIDQQVDKRHLEELFSKYIESKEHFEHMTKEENKRKVLPISDWNFYFSHSSYFAPEEDEYLFSWFEFENYKDLFIKEFLALPGHGMENRCMLYGHTHVPTLVRIQQELGGSLGLDAEKIVPFKSYTLEKGCTWVINPGSVGIPSDGDTRASYAIIEVIENPVANLRNDDTITFCKVYYDTNDASSAMEKKGYSHLEIRQKYMKRLIEATPFHFTPPSWVEHYKFASQVQRKNLGD